MSEGLLAIDDRDRRAFLCQMSCVLCQGPSTSLRYLDARTKRPDMVMVVELLVDCVQAMDAT